MAIPLPDPVSLINALSTHVIALASIATWRATRRLANIEQNRTTARFQLRLEQGKAISEWTPGHREDVVLLITNAGGHASSIEEAKLVLSGPRAGGAIGVGITQPNGHSFPSLNIQPGETVRALAAFSLPATDLSRMDVTLFIQPVLGEEARLSYPRGGTARRQSW